MLTPPRSMPPKYFYDELGAQLFDQICTVPEYYPTRTERALLKAHSTEILERTRPRVILELGSGSSSKTRELLKACPPLGLTPEYWPFDVSEEMLRESSAALHQDFDWLNVHALVGDYGGGLARLPDPEETTLAVFLGGTIGNFPADLAVGFLSDLRAHLKPGDFLLMGMDLVKPAAIIEAAYNDAQGLTAAFNLNLLNVLNRELQSDFDLDDYVHRAVFNVERAQIEMYLDARNSHQVTVGLLGETLDVEAGESILTEISRKFDADSRLALLEAAGYQEIAHWAPENQYFCLTLSAV